MKYLKFYSFFQWSHGHRAGDTNAKAGREAHAARHDHGMTSPRVWLQLGFEPRFNFRI